MDTASYQPAASTYSERGESGGIKMTLPLIGQKCYYQSSGWPRTRKQATASGTDGHLESIFGPHISGAIGQGSSSSDGRRCIQFHSSDKKSSHSGSIGERHARNGLHDLFKGRRRRSCKTLVKEGRKDHISDASARGNSSRLCDPAINGECPLLVGDY